MRRGILAEVIVGSVAATVVVLGLIWLSVWLIRRRSNRRSWTVDWDNSVSSQGESVPSPKRRSFMRSVPAFNYSIATEKVHPNPVAGFPSRNGQTFVSVAPAPSPVMTSPSSLHYPTSPSFPTSADVSRAQSLGLSWSDSDELSMNPGTDGRRSSVTRTSRQYAVSTGDDREKIVGRQKSSLSNKSRASQTPVSTRNNTPLQEKIELPSASMPPLPALPHPLVTSLENYGSPRPGRSNAVIGFDTLASPTEKQKSPQDNGSRGHGHTHSDSWVNKGRMSPSSYFTALSRPDSWNDESERQQVTQILASIAEASTPKKSDPQAKES